MLDLNSREPRLNPYLIIQYVEVNCLCSSQIYYCPGDSYFDRLSLKSAKVHAIITDWYCG